MAAVFGLRYGQAGLTGQILCARQFMNSLADSSLEEIQRAIEDDAVLSAYYEVGEKYIKSVDGRIWFSFAGLDRSLNSIKSKGRILLCWVDEAEPVTEGAWSILEPTLREEGTDWNAELWITWNPLRKHAAVEQRYRHSSDPLIKVAEINWRDNPKFPARLERQRQRDMAERPEQYAHIWEGDYAQATIGAYYAPSIAAARTEARIGVVRPDPLMTIRAFWDIGGTGAKADACAIWIGQFIGREIRALHYYEAVGQPLAAHVNWLRSNGYGNALCHLPHDGANNDKVYDVSYESALRQAGFDVHITPNQGAGAAMARVECARRVFPSIWFDAERCEPGLDALGWYHERRDEQRNIGLGPEHDWSSHCADAFGLMCIAFERLKDKPKLGVVMPPRIAGGWM